MKACLDQMMVFALGNIVLLGCMWTRHKVGDAHALKVAVEFVVFTTPIGLNTLDFIIQKAFDMSLKVAENLLNIRLVFEQINLGKARVVINKANIILVTSR